MNRSQRIILALALLPAVTVGLLLGGRISAIAPAAAIWIGTNLACRVLRRQHGLS